MNISKQIKVFVSYSWAIEKDSQIVDQISQLCKQREIHLIRDAETLKHGESIKRFMDELSEGDHVITIFSKPYFESKWCMYELLRIYLRGGFEQRTHPLIADDCDLQDRKYRIGLVNYWENQYIELKEDIKNIEPELITDEYEECKLFRDIHQKINELINFAANRVTTPLTVLKEENYSQLLDNIKLEQNQEDLSSPVSDQEFLREIRLSLAADLKKSKFLTEHIVAECNREFGNDLELHDFLINQCVEGQFVDVIQYLQSAIVDNFKSQDDIEINQLNRVAEDVLSKLVLFNIKNEWMKQFRQHDIDNNQQARILPEMSFGSVEMVASRESATLPKFRMNLNSLDIESSNGVVLESGIKSNSVFKSLIKSLYFTVFNRELDVDFDENKAVKKLQITIKQRKQQKNIKLRKNYFLLFPNENQYSALEDNKVQQELKKLLPDLSLIRIKTGHREDIFIVEDEELMVAISEFFNTLETYKAK